jgi:hypothetical protein
LAARTDALGRHHLFARLGELLVVRRGEQSHLNAVYNNVWRRHLEQLSGALHPPVIAIRPCRRRRCRRNARPCP